ncbi:sensor histidine kinase [Streptomyces violascens]|uniref:histidine kinase n=1 Tax=Streptomyces violascens TaxID=67381 RepID=A0ABQ3QGU2_9ACTN|nr:sensor histidine kinase [Streptomyces violascens]GGT90539.1 two-component sensor histidine kinase [Streptomyces violascens]GHI36508.1 two-component sensor histidine kinase [Streptomyces violascens]
MEEQQSPRAAGRGGPPRRREGPPPFVRRWVQGPDDEDRRGPRLPWPSTAALTVFVLVGSHFAAHSQTGRAPLDAFAHVLLVASCAALLIRLRHPVVAVFAASAAAMVYLGAGYPYGPVFLPVMVGCFTAVIAGHRRQAWGAIAMLWLGHLLVAHWLYRWLPPSGDSAAPWGQEVGVAAWAVAIAAVAELVRVRREQWARERAGRAAAEKRRADEERLRIARELHDVLAHSISVINVQAGVGLALLDSDPEQARTALTTIKSASKEALGEVRQVLETLRAPGEAPRSPAPGLERLPELVEQAASAGLTVETTITGKSEALSPGTDLAAFRIVQEALTNVVRHSAARTARVAVGYESGALLLRVDDDGPPSGGDAGGSGNGLIGMRERAAALGGTIDAGPVAGGGFRVTARLPLAAHPKETP